MARPLPAATAAANARRNARPADRRPDALARRRRLGQRSPRHARHRAHCRAHRRRWRGDHRSRRHARHRGGYYYYSNILNTTCHSILFISSPQVASSVDMIRSTFPW